MKTCARRIAITLTLVAALVAPRALRAQAKEAGGKTPRDYPVQPVPFTAVHLDDAFWLPRIEVNRRVTIPFAFEKCEETKRVYHFERAAAVLRGEKVEDKSPPGYPFDDTDVYKVIEGAAYTLSVRPDPKLEAYLDGLIAKIAAAQEKDGYLYTTRTISPESPHRWAGKERWELEKEDSHELYNLGHLYEAAVAHYQATGKRTLLDVALRTADLLDRTFGPGKRSIWPGHQITEMGLVKLYRVTGDDRHLALARFPLTSAARTARRGLAASTTSRTRGSSIRARRSATPCAPPTCTRAWPTWRLSPGRRHTSTPWSASGAAWSTASSTSPAASGRRARARRSGSTTSCPT
jgi:DUF1680 family protein